MWVNKYKGYGNIKPFATGADPIYVHASDFSEGDFNSMVEGVHLVYRPSRNKHGGIAKEVVRETETETIYGECVKLKSSDNEVVAACIAPDDYEGRAEDAGLKHGKLWAQVSDFVI